jgi:hypothetical protein
LPERLCGKDCELLLLLLFNVFFFSIPSYIPELEKKKRKKSDDGWMEHLSTDRRAELLLPSPSLVVRNEQCAARYILCVLFVSN